MNRENNEDYLDDLLNTAINKKDENKNILNNELINGDVKMKNKAIQDKKIKNEANSKDLEVSLFDELDDDLDLFKNFESELSSVNVEGFLKDFESEIEKGNLGQVSEIEATLDMDMLNNLDNIVNEVSENINSKEDYDSIEEESSLDIFPDIGSVSYEEKITPEVMDDVLGTETNDQNKNSELKAKELFGTEEEFKMLDDDSQVAETDLELFKQEAIKEYEKNNDDLDIVELIDEIPDDEDLANIGELLKKEENNELIEDSVESNIFNSSGGNQVNSMNENTNNSEENKKSKKKEGFLTKVLKIFDKKEKNDKEKKEVEQSAEVSDENLEILKELEKKEKTKKSSDKKKSKKVKEKKPKKVKLKKPKKEKPEVVYVPSEPIPKVPVILLIALGISIVVLTMTATKIAGYESYSKQAEDYFKEGKYKLAYEQLQGIDLQENDKELLEKVKVLSRLEKQKNTYDSFVKINMYSEALDALAKGVEHYRENYQMAENLGIESELQKIENEIESSLKDTFSMTPDQAMELRVIEDKIVYTEKINTIVEKQGLAIKEK